MAFLEKYMNILELDTSLADHFRFLDEEHFRINLFYPSKFNKIRSHFTLQVKLLT